MLKLVLFSRHYSELSTIKRSSERPQNIKDFPEESSSSYSHPTLSVLLACMQMSSHCFKKHSFNFTLVCRARWRLENLAIYFRTVQFNNSRKGKKENCRWSFASRFKISISIHFRFGSQHFFPTERRNLSRDVYFKCFIHISLPSLSSVALRDDTRRNCKMDKKSFSFAFSLSIKLKLT